MSTLAEILAGHAPYLSRRSDNTLCLRCLDEAGHGEFATIDEWAEHVARELAAAGYRNAAKAARHVEHQLFQLGGLG